MVKNATGGNKSKKQARSSGSSAPQQNIRKATEEGEIYAAITKIFGGPNCQVMCNDGVSRSCIIRNKFKTRGKRDNNITIGSWILVGIRDWEVRSDGSQKCDLLEVYSHYEKDKLKQIEVCDFKHLNSVSDSIAENNKHTTTSEGQMEFSSSVNAYDQIIIETESNNEESSDNGSSDNENEPTVSKPKSSVKEDKKKVSAPVSARVPVSARAPVSLRELMKTKPTTTTHNNDDWLTIDDI
jgi:initiation factor 1A